MRVGIVLSGGGAGGLQQCALAYAHGLKQNGDDVILCMFANSPLIAEARTLGVTVKLLRWPRRPWLFGALQALEIRRIFRKSPVDIVIGMASKGFPTAFAAMRGKVPVVTHCGSTRPEVITRLLPADKILVTSPEMRAIAAVTGASEGQLAVVPNFKIGPARRQVKRAGDVLRIGTMGRLTERKGFDLLIHAVHQMQAGGTKVDLVIAGAGQEHANLTTLARKLGVAVSFPGWIGNGERDAFLDGLDVFVCPSRFEPFGLVYLEAMQAGLPIVTTPTTGARAIFSQGKGAILVPDATAGDLASGLTLLSSDSQARARLAAEGQLIWQEGYSETVLAAQLHRVLADTLRQWGWQNTKAGRGQLSGETQRLPQG